MNNRPGILFGFMGAAVLALSAITFAAAPKNPQGQYHFLYPPFTQSNALSKGSLATYSPIKSIDGKTIQLRGEDGVVYIFTLTADTIYCQGGNRVSDWSFLKSVPKRASVTVLTSDAVDRAAIVIWDQAPTISTDNGEFDLALPPICK
jgi:hypothetical protein